MGITVPDLADEAAAAIAAIEDADELVVLVHAGHNDAQSSGDEPRVPEVEFVAAATGLDGLLSEHRQISRHAFVGLVPLLSLEDPGSVPFSDDQPGRSLQYDRALSGAVETHLELARPVADWRDRTTDGVHPNGAGHAAIADRVATWLGGAV
jgi:lysophospholipase L1-like esterase